MSSEPLLHQLEKIGAIVRDSHVVYTSGRHGKEYVNKDAIYPHTQLISALCQNLAQIYLNENVQAVLAPALGGIILSQWVAHHLERLSNKTVLALYAEKIADAEGFILKRGQDKLINGKRTLVLEDVLTTGGSVKKVVALAREHQANVIGVAALCNRGGVGAKELGDVPRLVSLIEVKLDSWDAADCPLCAAKVPVNTSVGKGREFLNG